MLNKVILMGRLTADPELRRTHSGTAVTGFTLAVSRPARKDGKAETDFIDVVAWSGTAEFAAKWFQKGLLAAVSGRLQVRNWEDKQGQKRRSFEVVAEEVHFAQSRRDARPAGEITQGDFADLSDDDPGELPF